MARREFRHALDDILAAIDGIQQAVQGRDLPAYRDDWLLRHGVQRGIEIISEASRLLPPDILARQPSVPWREVRAIGNVLRHECHSLSDQIIWRVVVDELPRLRIAIEALLKEFG